MIRQTYSDQSLTYCLYVDSMHVNYPSVVLCFYKALSNQGSPIKLKNSIAQPVEIQYIGSLDSTY